MGVRRTTNTYNDAGLRQEMISDLTGGAARTTQWDYDDVGRLETTTAADGTVITQRWNNAGDLVEKTLPGGLVLNYGYDDAHRLLLTKATGANVDSQIPSAPNSTWSNASTIRPDGSTQSPTRWRGLSLVDVWSGGSGRGARQCVEAGERGASTLHPEGALLPRRTIPRQDPSLQVEGHFPVCATLKRSALANDPG
jgi:YD repeat-containing protein